MKTTQRRICKGYLRVGYSKGVRLHPLHLAETQRQAEEWESFTVEKREGFACALTEDCR